MSRLPSAVASATYIQLPNRVRMSVGTIYCNQKATASICSLDGNHAVYYPDASVVNVGETNNYYEVTFMNGTKVRCTGEFKFILYDSDSPIGSQTVHARNLQKLNQLCGFLYTGGVYSFMPITVSRVELYKTNHLTEMYDIAFNNIHQPFAINISDSDTVLCVLGLSGNVKQSKRKIG